MNNFIFRLQQMNKRMENAFIQMFKGMFQTVQKAWNKHSPQMFHELKRFGKFTMIQTSKGWKRSRNWFVGQTIDRQIAIFVSVYTVVTFLRGTLGWFTILCFVIAWGFVHREKHTIPAVKWVWKETKSPRDVFNAWLWKILSFGYGIPIAMIGWGVISFILFWISFHFSKEAATFFGTIGWCGVMFGTFFYAVETHNKYKTKPPAKTTKTKPHLYRGPRKAP